MLLGTMLVGTMVDVAMLPAPLLAGDATAGADKATIAVAGPASGAKASLTDSITEAIARATKRLGDSGSATFAIETADDGCTPARAKTVAAELAGKGVALVVGHPCEGAAAAAADVYAANGIIFIATETRHPDFTAKRAGPSIFRLAGSDAAQGFAAAHALKAAAGERPIAIVHDRTRYAKTIAESAVAALKKEKREAITATIVAGDKEYGRLVAKIKDTGAVFFAGFPLEAGFITASLRRAGSSAQIIASDAVATKEFTSSFPAEARRTWVLMATRQDAAAAAEAALEIFARALSRVRTQASSATARAPVAVATTASEPTSEPAHAVKEKPGTDQARGDTRKKQAGKKSDGAGTVAAPPTEAEQLAAAIAGGTFATVLGDIRFDKNGDAVLLSFGLKTWDGTEWVPVSASGR